MRKMIAKHAVGMVAVFVALGLPAGALGDIAVGVGNSPPSIFEATDYTRLVEIGSVANRIEIWPEEGTQSWTKTIIVPLGINGMEQNVTDIDIIEELRWLNNPNGPNFTITDWHEGLVGAVLRPAGTNVIDSLAWQEGDVSPRLTLFAPARATDGQIKGNDVDFILGDHALPPDTENRNVRINKDLLWVGQTIPPQAGTWIEITLVEHFTVPEPASAFLLLGALLLRRR